jgi:hypothetical protein
MSNLSNYKHYIVFSHKKRGEGLVTLTIQFGNQCHILQTKNIYHLMLFYTLLKTYLKMISSMNVYRAVKILFHASYSTILPILIYIIFTFQCHAYEKLVHPVSRLDPKRRTTESYVHPPLCVPSPVSIT